MRPGISGQQAVTWTDRRIVHCDAESIEEALALPVGDDETVQYHIPDGTVVTMTAERWVKTVCGKPTK